MKKFLLFLAFDAIIFSSALSKTFSRRNVRAEDWTADHVYPEHKSWELCRSKCVLMGAECQSYTFNEDTAECEIGRITGTDVVFLHPKYGVRVEIDNEAGLPPTAPHTFNADGTQWEFNLETKEFVTNALIPPWSGTANMDYAVGMVYNKRGLFICGGNDDTRVCQYNAFGSEVWESWPSMNLRRWDTSSVALGPKTLWVLGGGLHGIYAPIKETEIFHAGKWIWGPNLPPEVQGNILAAVNVGRQEILLIGGKDAGTEYRDTTYSYSFITGTWTRKADMLSAKRWLSHGSEALVLSNGTRLVPIIGGFNAADLNHLDVYNVDSDFWVNLPNSAAVGAFRGRPAVVYKTSLIVFGDQFGSRVFEYDFETETWSYYSNAPGTEMYSKVLTFNN